MVAKDIILLCYNVVGTLVKENIGFKHKDYVIWH